MSVPAVELLEGHRAALESERRLRNTFAPPPVLTVSQWADRFRFLSREASAEPGRWRTDRAPFLREIMDAWSDPTVERIVFMKPAQTGGTEVLNNCAGYTIHQDPWPAILVQPTVDMAKMWSKERLDPMLRDTPVLRDLIHEGNRREKDQSIQRKTFPGGFLAMLGANSAAGLRSRPAAKLLNDEIDAWPQSAKGSAKKDAKMGQTGEGDPLSLLRARQTTFWNRKELDVSTPTVAGTSAIEREYNLSDQRRYFVPCPHCGHKQLLWFRNLVFDPENVEHVTYRCGELDDKTGEITAGCGAAIEEHYKTRMMAEGQWVAERPGRKIRGYWLNGLYSPWLSWAAIRRQWMEAQGDAEKLKVFVNTVLAETWRDRGDALDDEVLASRREAYPAEVPVGVGLLTCAVDVQGDRLEVLVKGWGKNRESWFIHHEQLWGDPAKTEVWAKLDLVRTRPFMHANGQALKIRWTFVDSGGHHTDAVYRYCKSRRTQNVYAIKGTGEPGRAPVGRPSKGNKAKVALFPLGVIALKDAVFAALRTESVGPGYMHFPMTVTDEYLRQLASERKVTRYISGRPSHTYVLIGGRSNEALDLECYAYAAFLALGVVAENVGRVVDKLATVPVEVEAKPVEPVMNTLKQMRNRMPTKRTGFVNRW